ncbi:MAG: lectin-like protein, partial [Opitutales bacterium]
MFRNSQNPLPKALLSLGIILAFFGVLVTFNSFQQEDESKTTNSTYLTENLDKAGYLDEKLPISTDKTLNSFREWCQIDYQDLSKDSVFLEFQVWMKKFESSNEMDDHRNGKLKQVLLEGEKLAQRRAKVLQKIIRGDPKTALSLATPQYILESLPGAVRKHLEKWESDFVDIQAKHVCFDPKHPGGFINRRASMHDGRNLRAWVYGKRRNLPSIRNLSVWGVSLDGDFAISDVPIMQLENGTEKFLLMGGKKFLYSNLKEFELFSHDVRTAENRAFLNQIPIRYPRTASSSGLTDYYERKYDLITNPSTWEEAKAIAAENNGTLVIINSEEENRFIRNMLDPDQVDYFGFDDEGNQVELAWIGATDNQDENSTIYNLETNTSSVIDLNATEGDWKWVNGDDVSSSYGIEEWVQYELNSSTFPNQDFAAIDFSSLSGNWLDVNATYQLPFVIEYELENEPQKVNVAIDGYRKVLVVPARFEDEGYEGSGSQTQQNSFEPVPQKDLYDAMQMVKDFFLRSSDKTFHLDAVITPTVTIPYPKYYSEEGKGEPNLFDSSGEFLIAKKFEYEDELELAQSARDIAGEMDEAWKWGGAAFNGILSISIDELNDTKPKKKFSYPPIITFTGGDEDPNNEGLTNQRFEPATGQAVTDATGEIIAIKILSPGAYYYSEPTIQVGSPAVDETDHNYKFNINLGTTCISWVGITTHDHAGAAGVGFVGAAGSYVDAMNTYGLANVITHELGHNFGLLHANKLITKSEKPNSDESEKIDYGNPYSIMGQGSIHMGGDLTVTEKVITKLANNFGLTYSKDISATSYINSDVIGLFSASDVESSTRKETEGSNLADNTFRIYRHDFDAAPLPLRQTNCSVFLPTDIIKILDKNMTYNVIFSGTGEGAEGTLSLLSTNSSDQPNANLEITKTGSGFASEPSAMVLEEEEVILTLDPIWIRDPTGSQWNEDESQYEYSDFSQSTLRDLSSSSMRGLRGLELMATNYSPKGLDYEDQPLNSYWLSYRRSASEYGISVLAGNSGNQENFLLDMTVNTPNDFSDAFLLLGHTFSDYDADVHFTPVSKGGIYPMEYIDVVVNMGSVQDDSAKSPEFSVQVSNPTPSIGEFVNISVDLKEGNTSNYGYSWFVNEIIETTPSFLNKPSILKSFSTSGHYV